MSLNSSVGPKVETYQVEISKAIAHIEREAQSLKDLYDEIIGSGGTADNDKPVRDREKMPLAQFMGLVSTDLHCAADVMCKYRNEIEKALRLGA